MAMVTAALAEASSARGARGAGGGGASADAGGVPNGSSARGEEGGGNGAPAVGEAVKGQGDMDNEEEDGAGDASTGRQLDPPGWDVHGGVNGGEAPPDGDTPSTPAGAVGEPPPADDDDLDDAAAAAAEAAAAAAADREAAAAEAANEAAAEATDPCFHAASPVRLGASPLFDTPGVVSSELTARISAAALSPAILDRVWSTAMNGYTVIPSADHPMTLDAHARGLSTDVERLRLLGGVALASRWTNEAAAAAVVASVGGEGAAAGRIGSVGGVGGGGGVARGVVDRIITVYHRLDRVHGLQYVMHATGRVWADRSTAAVAAAAAAGGAPTVTGGWRRLLSRTARGMTDAPATGGAPRANDDAAASAAAPLLSGWAPPPDALAVNLTLTLTSLLDGSCRVSLVAPRLVTPAPPAGAAAKMAAVLRGGAAATTAGAAPVLPPRASDGSSGGGDSSTDSSRGEPLTLIIAYSDRPHRLATFLTQYARVAASGMPVRLVVAAHVPPHRGNHRHGPRRRRSSTAAADDDGGDDAGGLPRVVDAATAREELLASLRAAVAAAIPDPVIAAGVTLLAVRGDAGGAFSRAVALREAARLVPVTGLMMFMDVDIPPSVTALSNCARNAVLGQQVYFPIFYSLYAGRSGLGVGSGTWRMYSYGVACLFRWDFERVGGWAGAERTYRGWGKGMLTLKGGLRGRVVGVGKVGGRQGWGGGCGLFREGRNFLDETLLRGSGIWTAGVEAWRASGHHAWADPPLVSAMTRAATRPLRQGGWLPPYDTDVALMRCTPPVCPSPALLPSVIGVRFPPLCPSCASHRGCGALLAVQERRALQRLSGAGARPPPHLARAHLRSAVLSLPRLPPVAVRELWERHVPRGGPGGCRRGPRPRHWPPGGAAVGRTRRAGCAAGGRGG